MSHPRICLSLYGTTDEICSCIRNYDADLFEIRLDLSIDPEGPQIRAATRKPLLFTAHGMPELLEKFWPFADYVDVEQGEATGQNAIVSVHAPHQDPQALWNRWSGEHMTKIVLETEDYDVIAGLIKLNKTNRPRAICFASGEIGSFSRILSVMTGARWIYACVPGRSTGPGQFTIEQLLGVFRLRRFDTSQDLSVFGIIGDPVSHSMSPDYHNRLFAEEPLPWIYLPFLCKDLSALLKTAPAWNSRGFSITHPFKEQVLSLLDSVSAEAQRLQSCNTVAYVNGHWFGTNTDVQGISALLEEVPLNGSRAAIIGAGASARAFCSILRPFVAQLAIFNRTPGKAQALASEFQAKTGLLQELKDCDYDVLIQTTPCGWNAEEIPVDPDHLRQGKIVIDSIYKDTLLLQKARTLGCRTIDGKKWFDAQAQAQFDWWKEKLNI